MTSDRAASHRYGRSGGIAMVCSGLLLATSLSAQTGSCGRFHQETHSLAYCLSGVGYPVIVLEAGMRNDRRTWDRLVPHLAPFGTVLTYDRAGLGESDVGPAPRTSTRIAHELRVLLEGLALPSPYILVGHSIGGRHVRTFATEFPGEVAAIILLDTPHEMFESRRLDLLDETEREARLSELIRTRASLGPSVQSEYAGIAVSKPPGQLPAVPLLVVSASAHRWVPDHKATEHEALWRQLQRAIAESVPGGRFVVLDGASHNMHREHPRRTAELVVSVIEDLARHQP